MISEQFFVVSFQKSLKVGIYIEELTDILVELYDL